MGEVIDFRGRRDNFMKGIQLTNPNNTARRVGYIGDRIRRGTPEQEANHRRLREAADYYYSLSPEERLEIQRRQMEKENARKTTKRQIKRPTARKEKYTGKANGLTKVIAGVAFTGLVAAVIAGGVNANETNQNLQNRKNLEALSQNQDALQELGISQEAINEIQSLQTELNSDEIENINDADLLDLGDRVEDIQMYTIKSKLANSLGVSEESIELSINYGDDLPTASVIVTKDDGTKTRYNGDGIFDFNDNISSEISDYIVGLGNTQTANSRLENGTADKSSVIEQYRSAIEDTSNIATKEVEIDENGNISLSQVSQQEIDQLIQNDGKTQDGEEER